MSFITNRTVITYANMLKNPTDGETIIRRNMSLEQTSASLRSFLLRVMVFNPFKRPNSMDLLDDPIFNSVRNPALEKVVKHVSSKIVSLPFDDDRSLPGGFRDCEGELGQCTNME